LIEENKALQKRAKEATDEISRKKRISEATYQRLMEENEALKKYIRDTEQGHSDQSLTFAPKTLFSSPSVTPNEVSITHVCICLYSNNGLWWCVRIL
jgi:hypothetical protein